MEWLSPIRELFLFIFPFLEKVPILQALLGFILVFFLPGFAWTLVFFQGRQINVIERAVLSFGLSIAIVTLSILSLDILVGIRVNGFNSILIIIGVTIIPVVFYYLNKLIRARLRRD